MATIFARRALRAQLRLPLPLSQISTGCRPPVSWLAQLRALLGVGVVPKPCAPEDPRVVLEGLVGGRDP
jgi:hypothetical protein